MLRVGVDVGGTFTDIVVYDSAIGRLAVGKVSSTPASPEVGVLLGLERHVGDLGRVEVLVHATTIGTNLFLGQMGLRPPEAVLITNRGFEDVLEIGRQNRPSLYDPMFQRPPPLVPRDRRLGVRGRIAPDGSVLEPLDIGEVRRIAREWCGRGIRVFIVSFLHSPVNPAHEAEAVRVVGEECPGAVVVAGSDVDPAPGEYERTSTAVVNALLIPVVSAYLGRLEGALQGRGFRGRLLVMTSSGGLASVERARRLPASLIESGPAAGAVAVAALAREAGIERALGFDMGGTTAKASSIIHGEPETVDMFEVGGRVHRGRTVRGSGYPVRLPHIDLAEVSAGGGTIAWVDPGGGLQLGPESAGSDPGPACYGRGGTRPTVTDANLLLGRLPETLAGGLRLDRGRALEAVKRWLAEPLGVDPVDAAWAVVRLANAVMARAIRLVTLERGHDPAEFAMYAFGGAGPLHALELAEEVGINRVIIPPAPGVFSALGLLLADYRVTLRAPIPRGAGDEQVSTIFRGLEERAVEALEAEGVPRERIIVRRLVEARYWGQSYTLTVPYPRSVEGARRRFEEEHERRYGFLLPRGRVELVAARVVAVGITSKPRLQAPAGRGDPLFGEREVLLEGGWRAVPVFRYEGFREGTTLRGPALVLYPGSTLLVLPGWRGRVGSDGSLVLDRG